MSIACIIVNYNDAKTVLEKIEELRAYELIEKIIVVDNASTDDSYEVLSRVELDKLVLIRADRNGGYGYGNNIGLNYAGNVLGLDYALISNPDTYISRNVIERLKELLEFDPCLAAAAPVMLREDEVAKLAAKSRRLEDLLGILNSKEHVLRGASAFPLRDFYHELAEAEPVSRRLFSKLLHYSSGNYRARLKKYAKEKVSAYSYVDAVAGSLLMLDISKVLELGAYDEKVFLYQEELILAKRLESRGYKTALLLDEYYEHQHSVSVSRSYKNMLSRQTLREESMLYYFKNYLNINSAEEKVAKFIFCIIRLEIMLYMLFIGFKRLIKRGSGL